MRKCLLCACILAGAVQPRSAMAGTGVKADFYGFIKTDFIYSDHGTTTNEYRAYAASGGQDRAFRASARGTRIGVNLSSGTAVNGKIEADFLGLTDSVGGSAGLATDLRLRHAYVTVKAGKTEFLAGQTYYPITPDIPETLNDYYLANSGDLYYRAPQLRVTYSPGWNLKLIGAVVRPTSKLTDAEGTHSALPGVQGKIEKTIGTARISLAGAAGVWKSTATQQTADISAVAAAFNIPFPPFTLSGEAWTGRNLYDFQGGLTNVGYGGKAVAASGGYLALKFKPRDDLWFDLIYGVDDPSNLNIAEKGKTRNSTALVNAIVRVYGCVETGLEISELATDYKGEADRASMNYQLTVKLLF